MRDGGDFLLKSMFQKLVEGHISGEDVQNLNNQITKTLSGRGIKIVFAFDEAQLLLEHGKDTVVLNDNSLGNLFHGIYQVIRLFNNPLFIGTTFSISKALQNVSKEGRRMVRPVIGSLDPWFLDDVEKILCHMFDVDDIKGTEEFKMLCYLLSGSPENIRLIHINLLKNPAIPIDKLSALINALENVVNDRIETSKTRLRDLLNDTLLMDRTSHLLRLLFGRESLFQIDLSQISNLTQYSYEQAFIEKTIAHVVSVGGKKVFNIVDPIIQKSYAKALLQDTTITSVWEFMEKEFKGTGEDFEMFMVTLILQERIRLYNSKQPISKSPLFKNAKGETFNEWQINADTFICDKHSSKKILQQNRDIPGIWFGQLAHKYFLDTFVIPDSKMGPDGMFYLKHISEEKYKLVTCAMTLISDPINHVQQPNKAINMFRTLSTSNIATEKSGKTSNLNYSIPKSLVNVDQFGWIIAPNLKSSDFDENNLRNQYPTLNSQIPIGTAFSSLQNGSLSLIFTGYQEIEDCINSHSQHASYNLMRRVWKKFV